MLAAWFRHALAAALAVGFIALLAGCDAVQSLRAEPVPQGIQDGVLLLRKGQVKDARTHFDRALKGEQETARNYLVIVTECERVRQNELVLEFGQRALASPKVTASADKAQFYNSTANALLLLKRYPEAIKQAREALRLQPNDPLFLNLLGYTLAFAGQELDEAVKLTTRAVQLARQANASDLQLAAFVDSLGWAQYRKEQYDEAIANITEASQLAPGIPEISYHLAMALLAKLRIQDALIHMRRAVNTEPANPEWREALNAIQQQVESLEKDKPRANGNNNL